MNRYGYYFTAIFLHLLMLLYLGSYTRSASSLSVKRAYLEVTLLRNPLPVPNNLNPVELKVDSVVVAPPIPPTRDSGPVGDSGSSAAGSEADTAPVPAFEISLEKTPPVEPPEPEPRESSVESLLTLPTSGPESPTPPVTPPVTAVIPGPVADLGPNPSGAPVSGTERGGNGTDQGGRSGKPEKPVVVSSVAETLEFPPVPYTNGHFYLAVYVAAGIKWEDAQSYALARRGYLVTITSYAENQFVYNLIKDPMFWLRCGEGDAVPENSGPWIGGTKDWDSGKWSWENGEGELDFAAWAPGEPDNRGGQQDRLCYYTNIYPQRAATWDDSQSDAHHLGFIIEFDSDPGTMVLNAAKAPDLNEQ